MAVLNRKRPGWVSKMSCWLLTGALALRLYFELAVSQRFIDDDKANAYISQPMRAPWKIEV